MEFAYQRWESDVGTQYIPVLPVILNGFPLGNALVDTGSMVTIFPRVLREVLSIDLNEEKAIIMRGASGENFKVFPSLTKLEYSLEQGGFRPIKWRGTVFFADDEDTMLLGHYQCLDQLVLTFDGRNRALKVQQAPLLK